MADLNQVVDFILKHEDAGLTGRVTTDAGGVTRWGIASKYHPDVDVAHLSLADARAIYVEVYLTPAHLHELDDQDVANTCGDMLVNPGPGAGAELIQRALNLCRPGTVLEDGIIGIIDIYHLNACARNDIVPRLRATRVMYYVDAVERHPERQPDLIGWLIRACS